MVKFWDALFKEGKDIEKYCPTVGNFWKKLCTQFPDSDEVCSEEVAALPETRACRQGLVRPGFCVCCFWADNRGPLAFTPMDPSARHLVFHGAIVLLVGLLCDGPYARAINRNTAAHIVHAWRVAHASLPIGALLMSLMAKAF